MIISQNSVAFSLIVESERANAKAMILSLEGINKEFFSRGTKIQVLKDVAFDVKEGEFVTIVGPSGCGKSTVLNMIAGLLKPDSGKMTFKDKPICGHNLEIGYITQRDNLFPWRTLLENVELCLELRGVNTTERRKQAEEMIGRVGLCGFETHYPHELSGGMRQRANIIRTLIYEPEVILMDEPFGPLDALTRITLQNQLLTLWGQSGKTVLFVTHDLIEALVLSDRVIVMTSRPGSIKSNTAVDNPRPRDVFHPHDAPNFKPLYDKIWGQIVEEVWNNKGDGK